VGWLRAAGGFCWVAAGITSRGPTGNGLQAYFCLRGTAVPRHSRVEISREGISNSANVAYVAPLIFVVCVTNTLAICLCLCILACADPLDSQLFAREDFCKGGVLLTFFLLGASSCVASLANLLSSFFGSFVVLYL